MFILIKKTKIILENAENFKITVIKFYYFFKYEQIGQFKSFGTMTVLGLSICNIGIYREKLSTENLVLAYHFITKNNFNVFCFSYL